MPNLDNIRKAQERREARANKKAENTQAAEDQERELAALSDRLRGKLSPEEKAAATAAGGDDDALEPKQTTKAKNVSRAASKRQRQEEAEKQAEADLQATVAPDDDEEIDLTPYRSTGRHVPLHVLNKLAARADQNTRDEAREVAQAVGKLAYAELSGRAPERGRHARNRRLAESISEMQKVRNAKTADKAE